MKNNPTRAKRIKTARKAKGNSLYADLPIFDAAKMSLDECLQLIVDPPSNIVFVKGMFPTDKHRDEYLATIAHRSDNEVVKLLHSFLIPSASLNFDDRRYFNLISAQKNDPELYSRLMTRQFYQRLTGFYHRNTGELPWE